MSTFTGAVQAEDDYLLTIKLFCGHCGALMFDESGTSRTGDVHRYYKCAAAKKQKSCNKKTVRKQWLEDLVVNETMKLIQNDTVIDSIVAAVMELQNRESATCPSMRNSSGRLKLASRICSTLFRLAS